MWFSYHGPHAQREPGPADGFDTIFFSQFVGFVALVMNANFFFIGDYRWFDNYVINLDPSHKQARGDDAV